MNPHTKARDILARVAALDTTGKAPSPDDNAVVAEWAEVISAGTDYAPYEYRAAVTHYYRSAHFPPSPEDVLAHAAEARVRLIREGHPGALLAQKARADVAQAERTAHQYTLEPHLRDLSALRSAEDVAHAAYVQARMRGDSMRKAALYAAVQVHNSGWDELPEHLRGIEGDTDPARFAGMSGAQILHHLTVARDDMNRGGGE